MSQQWSVTDEINTHDFSHIDDNSLFKPECILPSQINKEFRYSCGEQKLALAVFARAFDDLRETFINTSKNIHHQVEDRNQLIEWFNSPNMQGYAFIPLVEWIGCDPQLVLIWITKICIPSWEYTNGTSPKIFSRFEVEASFHGKNNITTNITHAFKAKTFQYHGVKYNSLTKKPVE